MKTNNTYTRKLNIFAVLAVSAASLALAQESTQPEFSSTKEASESLFQAVQSNDADRIVKILGGSSELASSQDGQADQADREMFVKKYQEMHRMRRDADGSVTLYVGAENWPFPVPLVAKDGKWRFDAEAGAKEVVFRRIGDNELAAIAACHEFAEAERPGANPSSAADASSPISNLVAKVSSGSIDSERLLADGYYFRLLKLNSGRHALIAYPADYRASGVMTFVVTPKNVVYEKDLGKDTAGVAAAITAFHKDGSWKVADK